MIHLRILKCVPSVRRNIHFKQPAFAIDGYCRRRSRDIEGRLVDSPRPGEQRIADQRSPALEQRQVQRDRQANLDILQSIRKQRRIDPAQREYDAFRFDRRALFNR